MTDKLTAISVRNSLNGLNIFFPSNVLEPIVALEVNTIPRIVRSAETAQAQQWLENQQSSFCVPRVQTSSS